MTTLDVCGSFQSLQRHSCAILESVTNSKLVPNYGLDEEKRLLLKWKWTDNKKIIFWVPRISPSNRENCAPTPLLRSHFLLVYLLILTASSNCAQQKTKCLKGAEESVNENCKREKFCWNNKYFLSLSFSPCSYQLIHHMGCACLDEQCVCNVAQQHTACGQPKHRVPPFI